MKAYLRVLDDEEKLPNENPSVGIILCKKADKACVEYVLQDYLKPMGVATYQNNLAKKTEGAVAAGRGFEESDSLK